MQNINGSHSKNRYYPISQIKCVIAAARKEAEEEQATRWAAAAKLAETDYVSALPIASGADQGLISVVFQQNEAVNNWILAAYYGSYAIFALIVLIVCLVFTLDKKIPQIRADLEERKRQAAEARGEVYVSPEEQDRIEMEKAIKELEENRIADLKAKCAKKGLDFDTENRKYLEKVAKKGDKKAKKIKVKN